MLLEKVKSSIFNMSYSVGRKQRSCPKSRLVPVCTPIAALFPS